MEVTNYSRNLYGPKGKAHLGDGGGDDDDDDDDSGEEKDSEATPNYQLRKRQHHLPIIQDI